MSAKRDPAFEDRCLELHLEGKKGIEIAKIMNCDPTTVIRARRSAMARLDPVQIERERRKQAMSIEEHIVRLETLAEAYDYDTKVMRELRNYYDLYAKLLGLDSPKRVEISGDSGESRSAGALVKEILGGTPPDEDKDDTE